MMNPFIVLFSTFLMICSSCNKKPLASDDAAFQNSPASKVPDELAKGTWFSGTLSAISFFDRDGHNLGREYEAGREFTFTNVNGKGRVKFWQYLGMKTYGTCVTEHYTYKEGTVVFEGDRFTFYPLKGNFKTVKDKCTSGNGTTKREAGEDDLKPDTYLWEIKMLSGIPHLYTYAETDTDHEDPLFVYTFAQ